jgi:hypothetical protein
VAVVFCRDQKIFSEHHRIETSVTSRFDVAVCGAASNFMGCSWPGSTTAAGKNDMNVVGFGWHKARYSSEVTVRTAEA